MTKSHGRIAASDTREPRLQKSLDDLRVLASGTQDNDEEEETDVFVDAAYWSDTTVESDQRSVDPTPSQDPFMTELAIEGSPWYLLAIVDSGLEMSYIPSSILEELQPRESVYSLIESGTPQIGPRSIHILGRVNLTLTTRGGVGTSSTFRGPFWVFDSGQTVATAAQHIRLGRDWIRRSILGYTALARAARDATTPYAMLRSFRILQTSVYSSARVAHLKVVPGRFNFEIRIFLEPTAAQALATALSVIYMVYDIANIDRLDDEKGDRWPELEMPNLYTFGTSLTALALLAIAHPTYRVFILATMASLPWLVHKFLLISIGFPDRKTFWAVAGCIQCTSAALYAAGSWFLVYRVNGDREGWRAIFTRTLWLYGYAHSVSAVAFVLMMVIEQALRRCHVYSSHLRDEIFFESSVLGD